MTPTHELLMWSRATFYNIPHAQSQQAHHMQGAASPADTPEAVGPQHAARSAHDMREVISAAFAGDDVAADFEKDKAVIAEESTAGVEDPASLPGWGLWANRKREPQYAPLPSPLLPHRSSASTILPGCLCCPAVQASRLSGLCFMHECDAAPLQYACMHVGCVLCLYPTPEKVYL